MIRIPYERKFKQNRYVSHNSICFFNITLIIHNCRKFKRPGSEVPTTQRAEIKVSLSQRRRRKQGSSYLTKRFTIEGPTFRGSTFLSYIKLADKRILRLYNCEMLDQVGMLWANPLSYLAVASRKHLILNLPDQNRLTSQKYWRLKVFGIFFRISKY